MAILTLVVGLIAGFSAGFAAASRRAKAARLAADRQATELRGQEQSALVGTIASGIAHEIRNPLSTLRMNLQLLREDWDNPITEREQKGRRRIDVLLRETGRMENVVQDFVRFASGHALRLERTQVNQLAGELLDFLAPQAERAHIRLSRDFAKDLPPVDADPNLLRQALLNLLVNAQQVLPGGGDIAVRTRVADGWIRLAVSDNGPGIPEEHREKVFTLYFSTKPGGTGLGLPMVKKIVEEHGGRIELETELRKGTTFTICLKPAAS